MYYVKIKRIQGNMNSDKKFLKIKVTHPQSFLSDKHFRTLSGNKKLKKIFGEHTFPTPTFRSVMTPRTMPTR